MSETNEKPDRKRQKMKRIAIAFTLFIYLIWPILVWAEYTATELFIIGWGDGPDEFIAYEAHDIDPGTPEDSTDDYLETGSGPSTAFVDSFKNIIITNPQHGQWKGFDSDGDLIFDFSKYSIGYKEWMWSGDLNEIYIDDSKNIYTITFWPDPHIFKINYGNATIDTLKITEGITSGGYSDINYTYDGSIMFFGDGFGWITYSDGVFKASGSWGVKLVDDRFYSIKYNEPNEVIIYSDIEPDIMGIGSDKDSVSIELNAENVVWVELLNSMEPTHLYLMIYYYTEFSYYEIWKYDLGYNIADKIIPTAGQSFYWSAEPKPFIMADGEIYEFRTRKDGMHVVRWTKE